MIPLTNYDFCTTLQCGAQQLWLLIHNPMHLFDVISSSIYIYHHKPNQSSKGLETIKPTLLPQTHEQSRKKNQVPSPIYHGINGSHRNSWIF